MGCKAKTACLVLAKNWATLSIELEERKKKKIGVSKRSFRVWYQENGKLPSNSFDSLYEIGVKVLVETRGAE